MTPGFERGTDVVRWLLLISLVLTLVGCASSPAPAAPRVAAARGAIRLCPHDPRSDHGRHPRRSTDTQRDDELDGDWRATAGVEEMERFIHAGLAIRDDRGVLRPQLGEVVPTTDNGLWKVLPDGRMELTWKLKPDARWHDGTPVTSADLAFTVQVGQDRDLPLFRNRAYNALESVEAVDASTVTVKWREPYIWADNLFTAILAMPLPRHLLEPTYASDKPRFVELPYWTEEFVGTGPYKVKEWARGSHLILQANDQYVLGRPKVDEIEMKFIPDPNTMTANILAGTVEFTMGRGFSVDAAAELRSQWTGGQVATPLENWIALYPQGINPTPGILSSAEFRRALLHAIDRAEMVQTIQHGLVPVAHTILTPEDPMYKDVERSIVMYDYDPRKAMEIIGQLGFTRGADGTLPHCPTRDPRRRDRGGRQQQGHARGGRLLEAHRVSRGNDPDPESAPQRPRISGDHPRLTIQRQPGGEEGMQRYHSREVALPENNWVGDNKGRYMNADLDALLDRYFVTIARGERGQLAGQIVQHMTSQAVPLGLFYDASAVVIGSRLSNVIPAPVGWNAHEWAAR